VKNGENWSHYLLYIQQVKIGHNICFTHSRCKTVTLFALHTTGEKWSHYLLYIQQVQNGEIWSHDLLYKQQMKIGHIICFTNSRCKTVTLFASHTAGEKLYITCFTNSR
jgi:hypothetical protein